MADMDSSLPVKTEVDIDERLQSKLVDYLVPTQGMEIDTDKDAHVKAKLRDDTGAPFGTESNPVYTVKGDDPADEVTDYQTTASVAKDAVANHDYVVTAGKTLKGIILLASASGEFKVELHKETGVATGIFDTCFTAFAQASSPFINVDFDRGIIVAAGVIIRVAITNRDKTQDLYSTILGIEV